MGTGVRLRVEREWEQVGMRLGTGKGMSVRREWEQEWE